LPRDPALDALWSRLEQLEIASREDSALCSAVIEPLERIGLVLDQAVGRERSRTELEQIYRDTWGIADFIAKLS
jgi:hypothetical protein